MPVIGLVYKYVKLVITFSETVEKPCIDGF